MTFTKLTDEEKAQRAAARAAAGENEIDVDTVEVVLNRDYWPEEDVRVKAGETITVPRAKAREMVTNGVIEPPTY